MSLLVEIAVQDSDGAEVAYRGGADRVELCCALSVGGLTPSAGTVAATAAVGLPVHALIRPRAGGFVYAGPEVALTCDDTARAIALGAAGVVIGALTAENAVDVAAVGRFVATAGGGAVTFHRAFDVVADPAVALEQLIDLGITRVLTSGGAARAVEGLDRLAALVEQAAGRIEIQAGGGVRIEDIPTLARIGVDAVHLSARGSAWAGPAGPGGGTDDAYDVTDPVGVDAAVAAAKAAPSATASGPS